MLLFDTQSSSHRIAKIIEKWALHHPKLFSAFQAWKYHALREEMLVEEPYGGASSSTSAK